MASQLLPSQLRHQQVGPVDRQNRLCRMPWIRIQDG